MSSADCFLLERQSEHHVSFCSILALFEAELDVHTWFFEIYHFLIRYKMQRKKHTISFHSMLLVTDTRYSFERNGR
jgi:hypothetical protein